MATLVSEEPLASYREMDSFTSSRDIINPAEGLIFITKRSCNNCKGTAPEDDNDDRIDEDREDCEDGIRDEINIFDRPLENFQSKNLNKSEAFICPLGQQEQEREPRKEILRRMAKNQGTIHNSEGDSSRITALYEIGKGRVMFNNEAATKLKADKEIDNLESSEISKRIIALYEHGKGKVIDNRKLAATKMETDKVIVIAEPNKPSGRITALYELGKGRVTDNRKLAAMKLAPTKVKTDRVIVHIDINKLSKRITALYELGKGRVTDNRKLAATKLAATKVKTDRVIVHIDINKLSKRITALYELGKGRVAVKREVAATKFKTDRVIVNTISKKPSKRITALYKLGKDKVMINRKLAALKLRISDDRAKNIAALSDTKASASEAAGRRLYLQAQLRAERNKKLIQKVRATPSPQMELATHKPMKRRKSSIKHFFALYEKGKNQGRANIKLETKGSENKKGPSKLKTIARYANIRQSQLYELGRQRLVDKKLNERKRKE